MFLGFPCSAVVKNLPPGAGDTKDMGLIPESGTSVPTSVFLAVRGKSHGPMDRGAWWPIAHRVAEESDTTECSQYTHTDVLAPVKPVCLHMEVSFLSGVQVLQKIILLEIKILPWLGLPNCGFKP